MRENLLSSLSEETRYDIGIKDLQQKAAAELDKEGMLRRNLLSEDFRDDYPNIYEAIIVMSKRARQIGQRQARIIEQFMAAKAKPDDDDEDDDIPLRSLDDDDEDSPKLPRFEKPTVIAMNEMKKGELKYEDKE